MEPRRLSPHGSPRPRNAPKGSLAPRSPRRRGPPPPGEDTPAPRALPPVVIAFASLFLALVVGVVPVTVLVEKPVAAIRVELDGRTVGRLAEAPWTLSLDFGAEPLPHELVARALDSEGREIG